MKRRDFLKSTAALGGSLAAISSTPGCTQNTTNLQYAKPSGRVTRLKQLENKHLAVTLFTDASAKIIDKLNNVTWDISPVAIQDETPIDVGHVWVRTTRSFCEQYPGRFIAKSLGNHIHMTLVGRQNRIAGNLVCDITLENDWLVFKIIQIDESLPSLIFPPPVVCDSLVIPRGTGAWLRKPSTDTRFDRKFYPFWSRLNMRWFGGCKDDACWLAILDQGMPDSGAYRDNRSMSPAWLKSLGRWSPPFSVRYNFAKGNYVTLAKTFRKWAIENGLFKSLEEKIAENSNLKNFIGGRLVSFHQAFPPMTERHAQDLWLPPQQAAGRVGDEINIRFTHADVLEHLEKAKSLGFKKGPVILRGWINRGYDASHPDIWPPEPALGSIDQLKQIMSLSSPVVGGLHDNYQDMYDTTQSFPKGVNIMHDGRLMPAGFWAGGQAYAVGGRAQLHYAKRNWRDIKSLNPKAMFIDTTTAMQMHQSYEKDNLLKRAHDLRYKTELLQFYRDQRVLIGSEEVADFGAPIIDWFENRHARTEGEYVPLWPLVYHDAAVCTRYRSRVTAGAYPNWLEDMLWGYMLLFRIDSEWRNADDFKNTFHVDHWHQKIATAEMLDHKFLTEDYKVEQTTFSSGHAITVNFSSEPAQIEGKTIPPHDYIIKT